MRTGTFQTGKFHVQPGMAFVMPAMDTIANNGFRIKAGEHPWLITNIENDYIEAVMCATLSASQENKRRIGALNDNSTDIKNPCPPMDPNSKRLSYLSFNTFMAIPKKLLFSEKLKILNENNKERNFSTEGTNSLYLDADELKFIQDQINEYISNHSTYDPDPFECAKYATYKEDLDEGYTDSLPDGFSELLYNKKFGWKHLPNANPLAVYPFKDQMHDYEKTDPELIRIAERKSKPSRKPKSRHKIDSHLESIFTDTYETVSKDTEDGFSK